MLVAALLAIGPADLPRVAEIGIGWSAAGFTLLAALGASVLIGLAPAVQAWRGDLRGALQGGERGSSLGGRRVRTVLVFAEVALSTVLLMTAALLARSFQQVQAVDPGFRPAQVLTVRLSLPRARYNGRAAIESFYNQVQPRLAAIAGVRSAAAANVVPMNGYLATTAFFVDGVIAKDAPEAHYRMISPDYFRVLGIPLREGRSFTTADRHDAAPVAIINATFARRYFAGRSPVGRRMRLDDGEKVPREVEIVGVVGDVRHFGLEQEVTIEAYVPIAQVPDQTTIWLANNMYWVVHTDGAPLAVASTVRREIAAVDPAVPASFVRSMDQWMAGTLAPRRFNLQLVGGICRRGAAARDGRRLCGLGGGGGGTAAGDRHPRRAGGFAPRGDRTGAANRPGAGARRARRRGRRRRSRRRRARGDAVRREARRSVLVCRRRGDAGRRGRAREPGSCTSGRQSRSDCRPARRLKRRYSTTNASSGRRNYRLPGDVSACPELVKGCGL